MGDFENNDREEVFSKKALKTLLEELGFKYFKNVIKY